MTISIGDYSEEGSILDKIIAQEQAALKLLLETAAARDNLCKLTIAVDDARSTQLTAVVTITELKDGRLAITVNEAGAVKGDMAAFYMSFADGISAKNLTYTDASKSITAVAVGEENVTKVEDSYTNMNGGNLSSVAEKGFDIGFKIGYSGGLTADGAPDDYQSISFILGTLDGTRLSAEMVTELGVRALSVTDLATGMRTLSDKAVEEVDANSCFHLKSDYIMRVNELEVAKQTATGDIFADARLADPTATFAVAGFTTADGIYHKAGDSVAFGDPRLGLKFTMYADGRWEITGENATALSQGQFPSLLVSVDATKTGTDATTIASATADIIFGVDGLNSAAYIKDASYKIDEGQSARFDLMANVTDDLYDTSRLANFSYASAKLVMADGTSKEMPIDYVRSLLYFDKAGGLNVFGFKTDELPANSQLIVTVEYQTMDQFGTLSANVGTATVTINGLNDTPVAAAISATAAEGYTTGNIYDWLAQAQDADMGAVLDFHSIAGYQISRTDLAALNTARVIEAPPLVDQYLNLFKKVFGIIFNSDGVVDPKIAEMAKAYYTALVNDLTKVREAMGDTRGLTLEEEMALFRKWTSRDYVAETNEYLSKLLLSGGEGDGGTGYEQLYFTMQKTFASFRLMDDRVETVYGSKVLELDGGSLEIWGDGRYALKMAANADGIVSHDLKIGYAVQDEYHAVSNEAFVNFFNNNTPEAAADFIFAALGTTARVSLLGNDSDANGDKLALAAVNDQAFVCKVQDTYDSTIIDPALTSDSRIATDSTDYIKDDGTVGDTGCTNTFKIGAGLVMTVNEKGDGLIDTSGLAAIVNEAYRLSFWNQEILYPRDPNLPDAGFYYAENIWGNDERMFASLLAKYGVAYDAATGDITANFTYGIADGYGGMGRATGYITLDVNYEFTPASEKADFIYQNSDAVLEQQVYDKLSPTDVWT